MPVTVILRFADQGWHVRWRTPDPVEFEATRRAFKDILSLHNHYWDPEAFKSHLDRGGSHAAMVKINAAYELALAAC